LKRNPASIAARHSGAACSFFGKVLVAERGGPTLLARIGVMRALNRHYVPEFNHRRNIRGGA